MCVCLPKHFLMLKIYYKNSYILLSEIVFFIFLLFYYQYSPPENITIQWLSQNRIKPNVEAAYAATPFPKWNKQIKNQTQNI